MDFIYPGKVFKTICTKILFKNTKLLSGAQMTWIRYLCAKFEQQENLSLQWRVLKSRVKPLDYRAHNFGDGYYYRSITRILGRAF